MYIKAVMEYKMNHLGLVIFTMYNRIIDKCGDSDIIPRRICVFYFNFVPLRPNYDKYKVQRSIIQGVMHKTLKRSDVNL